MILMIAGDVRQQDVRGSQHIDGQRALALDRADQVDLRPRIETALRVWAIEQNLVAIEPKALRDVGQLASSLTRGGRPRRRELGGSANGGEHDEDLCAGTLGDADETTTPQHLIVEMWRDDEQPLVGPRPHRVE